MVSRARALAIASAVGLLLGGCNDDGQNGAPAGGEAPGTTEMGGRDDGELGGSADVAVLARAPLESTPPPGAAWNAVRVRLAPGERIEHAHAFSTVYAEEGEHLLTVASGEVRRVPKEGGAAVQAQTPHVHAAPADRPSVFWDVLLAEPGVELPGAPDSERVFETEPLEGIPDEAQVAFVEAVLPARGGRTTVHTHPGPETIYVTDGPFEYENGIEGTSTVEAGAVRSIPPGTPVQKRNPGERDARFISWFVVDPAERFAPPAELPSGG